MLFVCSDKTKLKKESAIVSEQTDKLLMATVKEFIKYVQAEDLISIT
jgi:hypothetical protein